MSFNNPSKTPAERVAELRPEIFALLSKIERKVVTCVKGKQPDQIMWEHTGNLEYVKHELEKITKFLKA